MGKKDIIGKDILKQITLDFANLLFDLNIDPERLELLETESQRIEDRRADLIARVHDRATGEPYLLHIELQNNNDARMPLRMLRYFTDIGFNWPGEPVLQYVIYIGKTPVAMDAGIENPGWRYRYELFDMRQLDCQRLFDQGTPDALVLAILCDFKGRNPRDV